VYAGSGYTGNDFEYMTFVHLRDVYKRFADRKEEEAKAMEGPSMLKPY
jgi:hypothetical protein